MPPSESVVGNQQGTTLRVPFGPIAEVRPVPAVDRMTAGMRKALEDWRLWGNRQCLWVRGPCGDEGVPPDDSNVTLGAKVSTVRLL